MTEVPVARPKDGQEIVALTGPRGIAAVLIAVYHLSFLGPHGSGRLVPFIQHSYLLADLFFILGGFIMATTSHRITPGVGWRTSGGFLRRRLARIYPL